MNIHLLTSPPEPELQREIESFEATFRSPLPNGRSFHVQYVPDRTAFVRTLGDEFACIVAEKDGQVMGIVEFVVIKLRTPDEALCDVAYCADIKLRPEARRSMATARLIQRGIEWRKDITMSFSVVLDDSPLKPPDYSGRAGIPQHMPLSRISLIRFPVEKDARPKAGDERYIMDREPSIVCYTALTRGRYAPVIRPPAPRTLTPPAWIAHPDGTACGRFEDRRRVRKLIRDDGTELCPAYLSCFAFTDPDAAVEVISVALRHAAAGGFNALRICMHESDLAAIQRRIGPAAIQGVGATVYGTAHFTPDIPWSLNAPEV